jgi:hypothetical protein
MVQFSRCLRLGYRLSFCNKLDKLRAVRSAPTQRGWLRCIAPTTAQSIASAKTTVSGAPANWSELTSATAAQSCAPAASAASAPSVQHSTKAINYRPAGSNLEIVFNGGKQRQSRRNLGKIQQQSKTRQSSASIVSPMWCGPFHFNQQLSERRSDNVRDFLAEQGVAPFSMTAHGFGKTQPVASNDTAEGRQRNRRVELVVNGDAIGKSAAIRTATPTPWFIGRILTDC